MPGCHRIARGTLHPNGHKLFRGRIRQADQPTGERFMLNQTLVVAQKEIVDGLRDVRSVMSSLLYALMGPLVVGLVSIAIRPETKTGAGGAVLVGMMSVFTLVAAFVGGMNVAMDTVPGERQRRSLLPLLLNPVPRLRIVLGKWLAVSLFSVLGLILNLLGFAVVIATSGMHIST